MNVNEVVKYLRRKATHHGKVAKALNFTGPAANWHGGARDALRFAAREVLRVRKQRKSRDKGDGK